MFVDTSAIVAILSRENDAREIAEKIEVGRCTTSALVILESAMRLSTKLKLDPILVESRIQSFLEEAQIRLAPMDRETARLAVEAFAAYGKGRSHPAQLNMADCLSYACAKAQGVALLYKGNDFAHTDLK